ncbi:hypothetical protein JAAARDRAFT_183581 [Jaapia argillacea MUCL 33604]|uniref:MYND-type domain-containing protein n=1 Tax=Jaapia argillacea MUCL 33604 TaxID=933084 RepID=A0A067PNS3_9AGAM|nr:hypothetical protein JAAARDRAFT_183581 [Jaapia argillacea MUCL 33604]
MVLDLSSPKLEWVRLSGTARSTPKADNFCPGPRRSAACWTNQEQDRIYIMFGLADRQNARLNPQKAELHGEDASYPYDDLWSWSITGGEWRRERMSGNCPCPRSEMACALSPKLNKTIFFGGYSPCLPTIFQEIEGREEMCPFSYYADTFIYEPSLSPDARSNWRQVITRGFPTYRAHAQLFADPETGKIFLFGGYANADYISYRKRPMCRAFNDLWQLKLDVPGGYFEGVDMEEESRTAGVGQLQRCFTCGNTGHWKKCGGSCKGHAFFCDQQCQKEGWKEHRRMHQCAKV